MKKNIRLLSCAIVFVSALDAGASAQASGIPVIGAAQTAGNAHAGELVSAVSGVQSVAMAPVVNDSQTEIKNLIASGRVGGVKLQGTDGLRKFYEDRSYAPVWSESGRMSANARAAIDLIKAAASHGLNPENYHMTELEAYEAQDISAGSAGTFDVELSDAVARYGKDMTGMRLSPVALEEDPSSWSRGMMADQVLAYVTSEGNAAAALKNLEPSGKLYQALKEELTRLETDLRDHPEDGRNQISYAGMISPGRHHSAILKIRERLNVAAPAGTSKDYYDEALAQAVRSFQSKNGLKPDAVIGKRTVAAINQSRTDRLIKVVANMERLRWMKSGMPDRYVMVNIPAQTLWAIENGKVVLQMPVIIGKPDWPTQSFAAKIQGIRFNPSWHVPDNIKAEDFLPALQKDANALEKKNIQLIRYTSDGAEVVNGKDVDWSKMTASGLRQFGMVQDPGDKNPLGRIRVLMPNRYDIYLHDTNSPSLFSHDYRALSHGCVRLAEPKKIASFILGANKNWTDDRIDTLIGKSKTVEIRAESDIGVFIMYNTIWQDDSGDLVVGDDIYGRDLKLVKALMASGKLALPLDISNFKSL